MIAEVAAPRSMVGLELDLDVFDGPFDLLVTLVLRQEIDLREVRVSRIIAEYVAKLAESGDFDIEATSRFVVLVAALLEVKSRLLLEDEADDELVDLDPDEAAEGLVERLVRYSTFKNAAGALRALYEANAGRFYRTVPPPAELCRRPLPAGALRPRTLAVALAPLLREPPRPDATHLADLAVDLLEELGRLRGILGEAGRFTFAAVASRDRLERAVTFFALLELHSSGEVMLSQERHFGDILVTSVPVAAVAAAG
jgi:segregation and condensation protein A